MKTKLVILLIVLVMLLSGCGGHDDSEQITIVGQIQSVELNENFCSVSLHVYIDGLPYRLRKSKDFYGIKIGWCVILRQDLKYKSYFNIYDAYPASQTGCLDPHSGILSDTKEVIP